MDERFELIIDVQSKGIRATLDEIAAADAALVSLNAEGKISKSTFAETSGVFSAVAAQLSKMESVLTSGAGSWKNFTTQVKDARAEAEAFAKAQAQVKNAQAGVAGAQKSRSFEAELQGLTKVEQAEKRLALARKEYYNANRQVSRASASGDADRQVAALKRQEVAVNNLAKAERQRVAQVAASGDMTSKMGAQEKATVAALQAQGQMADNLPRLRYALYDVSSSLIMTGGAMTALSVATGGVAISMQRSFADVLRTTGTFGEAAGEAEGLRKEFEALFTSMPSSWADLTEIGTLAGQLNIARGSVAEFTELVAMFAATTDVSVEQAATAFGRLAQLLNVPDDELQNLGSSILAVGVNSIATESQIIAVSTQITSMAATAGFSADQVFGLSAALAALGTQPELSRGVVTRLFTKISVAINEGGDNLERFGRLAGQTGAQFAESWGTDASGSLLKLMEGLGKVENSKAVETLTDLGITAARDIPTILRLAQNSEVLADSLNVAAQGYADGTALGEQYSVISSTVAEKLNVLVNNFQNLTATVGSAAGGIGGLVDVLIWLVKGFTQLVDNPVSATILGVVLAVTALTGAVALLGGLLARGVAGLIAMKTVTVELAKSGLTSSVALNQMTTSLFGVTASTTTATAATRAFGTALKWAIPVLGAIMLAAAIAAPILENAFKSASEKATDFFGDISGFSEAIQQDTAAWDGVSKVMGTFEVNTKSASDATVKAEDATKSWLGVQGEVSTVVDGASNAVESQTMVLDKNADAWLRNSLASNEAFKRFANDESARATFEALGGNIDDFIAAGLEGRGAVDAYILGLKERAQAMSLEALGGTGEEFAVLTAEIQHFERLFGPISDGVSALSGATLEQANVNSLLADSVTQNQEAWAALNGEMIEAYEGFRDAQSGAIGLENSIFGLGSALAENGAEWSLFSEAGRTNVESLMSVMSALATQSGGDAASTAASFQGLYDFLISGSHATREELTFLREAIASLGGSQGIVTKFNPTSFFSGWDKGAQKAAKSTKSAGSAADSAAKKVRTLIDYGNDLQKVFSRAFDIRFSGDSTLDKITSTFLDMRDALNDAARNIQRLKAEIQGLESDMNIQKYFLGIAIEYGDSKRAEAIQANLAKLQAELADKTADLAKEQDKGSKTLVGNSKAAIENREQVQGLVKQYQDHITALASSGMSQTDLARRTAELKEQFIQQATQLGYSSVELEKYAAAFDDVAVAIAKIPRNLTVNVDANPAITALAEFESALDRARSNAGRGISTPSITNPNNARELRRLAKEAEMFVYAQDATFLASQGGAANLQGARLSAYTAARLRAELAAGQYYNGGFTGTGGKYEPAGVVHRGEYVVPKHQVNQRTGLPYADAMGRLTQGASGPGYASGGFVRSSPAAMALQLASMGPMAMQQFHQVMSDAMRVYLDGRDISENSSRNYAQQTAIGAN